MEGIEPSLCAKYLEYLIDERKEESTEFHDRLAELYLSMTLIARKRGDSGKWQLMGKFYHDYSYQLSRLAQGHARKALTVHRFD